jgi:predicted amidophosphoribosyltransferase
MKELVSASQDEAPSRLTQFRGGLRAALRVALDVALPPLCPSCRAPLGDGVGLCAECWSKLSLIEPPYCARLGIPFTYDPGPGLLSMEAIANPPAYDRARAAVRYDDIARALVLSFKYGDRLDLAPMMGRWMARAGRELLSEADALLPVPLHWRRLWARRFNQSAALAGTISDIGGVPVLHGDVADRRLVLIDDVLTSGATVDTCARALLRAAAAHVDVLVFARVVAAVRSPI